MKTLQRLTGAVLLALMLGVSAFGDDPPPDPLPVCGHMDAGKCTPDGSTQMQTDDAEGGHMDAGIASAITEATLTVFQNILSLV